VSDTDTAEPATFRVYVNERGVSVPHGSTALDAVRAFDAAFERNETSSLVAGTRRLTDSRGLPVESDTPVHGGAIYRIVAVRESLPSVDESTSAASTVSSSSMPASELL
jgi:hypothetical protein